MEVIKSGDKRMLPLPADYDETHVLVLSPDKLNKRYHFAKFQLVKPTGGFGCKQSAIGSRVYGRHIADGEDSQFRRYDFIGLAPQELIDEALKDDSEPLAVDLSAMNYMALGYGYWGKGDTIEEAKKQCRKAGGRKVQAVFLTHEETTFDGFVFSFPEGAPKPERVWSSKELLKSEAKGK